MRAVVYGLALYMGTFRLGPSTVKMKVICPIAQLGEHCTGIAEVVGSNPAQRVNLFSGLCSCSVTAALALMTVITQLLLWDKLLSIMLEIKTEYELKINKHLTAP